MSTARPEVAISPDLQKRIDEQREREKTLELMKRRKKKQADEKLLLDVINECKETKNRRKLVVTVERLIVDEECEIDEESPIVVKARLLIKDLTEHYALVEELRTREKAREALTKRERGEITRVRCVSLPKIWTQSCFVRWSRAGLLLMVHFFLFLFLFYFIAGLRSIWTWRWRFYFCHLPSTSLCSTRVARVRNYFTNFWISSATSFYFLRTYVGVGSRTREIKRLLKTVEKDGLGTFTLSEFMLLAAPLLKQRNPRAEMMRRYKVRLTSLLLIFDFRLLGVN